MKNNPIELWSASLLDTFGDTVRELRRENNRSASITIARSALLLGGLIVALLLRYWLI